MVFFSFFLFFYYHSAFFGLFSATTPLMRMKGSFRFELSFVVRLGFEEGGVVAQVVCFIDELL